MSVKQRKVRFREDDDYSNATFKWSVKRLDHISCLLQIIKRSICPPQGIAISIHQNSLRICYGYYLLTIYTELQLNSVCINQRLFEPVPNNNDFIVLLLY